VIYDRFLQGARARSTLLEEATTPALREFLHKVSKLRAKFYSKCAAGAADSSAHWHFRIGYASCVTANFCVNIKLSSRILFEKAECGGQDLKRGVSRLVLCTNAIA